MVSCWATRLNHRDNKILVWSSACFAAPQPCTDTISFQEKQEGPRDLAVLPIYGKPPVLSALSHLVFFFHVIIIVIVYTCTHTHTCVDGGQRQRLVKQRFRAWFWFPVCSYHPITNLGNLYGYVETEAFSVSMGVWGLMNTSDFMT